MFLLLVFKKPLAKSYDYITAVLCKQRKVLPFSLIYGDGTIHKGLTRAEVELLYNTMTANITDYYEVKHKRETNTLNKIQ